MSSTAAPSTATQPTLLVVDDESKTLRATSRILGKQGYHVLVACDGDEAIKLVQTNQVDVCLLDMVLPSADGVQVMGAIKQIDPHVECIIFTAHASPGVGFEALNAGAVDYFEKPIHDMQRFNRVLRQAASRARAEREEGPAGATARAADNEPQAIIKHVLIGTSEEMQKLRWHVERLAPRNASVLVLGPTGAGKNRVALALHEASGRSGKYVHVNCANLDSQLVRSELFGHEKGAFTGADRQHKGAFERGAGGTVFLDEIGEIDTQMQARLLRVLEEGRFTRVGGSEPITLDARVIAASNRNLDLAVTDGSFRADLYNRLRIKLQIPPLNDRRGDIPQLVYYFIRLINEQEHLTIKRVPRSILNRLVAHDWKDNVRGLWNILLETAIYSSEESLDLDALPEEVRRAEPASPEASPRPQGAQGGSSSHGQLAERFRDLPYNDFKTEVLQEFVGMYLRHRLAESGGNITRASERAEMLRPNFKRLMKKFGVPVPKGD